MDYWTISHAMLTDLHMQYPDHVFEFTGFSMGGALAQRHALYWENSSAIVFGSNGIEDIVHASSENDMMNMQDVASLHNFFHVDDETPRMDCQMPSASICTFTSDSNNDDDIDVHANLVYGNGFINAQQQGRLQCTLGKEW